jgi:hypothetical protein
LADEVEPHPGGPGQITGEPKSFPTQLHFGLGRGVDVLSGFQYAAFPELYSRSNEGLLKVELLDDLRLPVRITSLSDLVESWRARGTPRDSELTQAAEKIL